MNALAHVSREIDKNAGQMIAIEVESDGKRAIRVQHDRRRWRPSSCGRPPSLLYEATSEQLPHQIPDGLTGQLGAPGDIGA